MQKKKYNINIKTRELALQIIYSWNIFKNNNNIKYKIKEFKKIKKNIFYDVNIRYLIKILNGVQKNYNFINNIINKYIYNNTKYIGKIELSILYLSIYELKISKKLPYRIIINESIIIAKKFGAYNSYKLINKILDNINKNIINKYN